MNEPASTLERSRTRICDNAPFFRVEADSVYRFECLDSRALLSKFQKVN